MRSGAFRLASDYQKRQPIFSLSALGTRRMSSLRSCQVLRPQLAYVRGFTSGYQTPLLAEQGSIIQYPGQALPAALLVPWLYWPAGLSSGQARFRTPSSTRCESRGILGVALSRGRLGQAQTDRVRACAANIPACWPKACVLSKSMVRW